MEKMTYLKKSMLSLDFQPRLYLNFRSVEAFFHHLSSETIQSLLLHYVRVVENAQNQTLVYQVLQNTVMNIILVME